MDRIELAIAKRYYPAGKGVTLVQIMDISPVDERTRKVAVKSFEVGVPVGVIKSVSKLLLEKAKSQLSEARTECLNDVSPQNLLFQR